MPDLLTPTFLTALLAAAPRGGGAALFASLGETIAEQAGMLNVGLEGMMITGRLRGLHRRPCDRRPVAGLAAGAVAGMARVAGDGPVLHPPGAGPDRRGHRDRAQRGGRDERSCTRSCSGSRIPGWTQVAEFGIPGAAGHPGPGRQPLQPAAGGLPRPGAGWRRRLDAPVDQSGASTSVPRASGPTRWMPPASAWCASAPWPSWPAARSRASAAPTSRSSARARSCRS